MINNDILTFQAAGTKMWEYCCSFGMVPASFVSREEMMCVYNAFKTYAGEI
jgi:hypothetical protein